jgi:hypothetical protein
LPHFHTTKERTSDLLSDITDASTADRKRGSAFYFVAILALSRLIRRTDNILDVYEPSLTENDLLWLSSNTPNLCDAPGGASHFEKYSDPPTNIVQELIH